MRYVLIILFNMHIYLHTDAQRSSRTYIPLASSAAHARALAGRMAHSAPRPLVAGRLSRFLFALLTVRLVTGTIDDGKLYKHYNYKTF